MARSDRLFRLLQAMRVMPAPITAARLAEETGVSLRSLYRDIDSLQGGRGADRWRARLWLPADRGLCAAAADLRSHRDRGAGARAWPKCGTWAIRRWPRPLPRCWPRWRRPCPTIASSSCFTPSRRSTGRCALSVTRYEPIRRACWEEQSLASAMPTWRGTDGTHHPAARRGLFRSR